MINIESVYCLVQTLLQEIIGTAKWQLPCLPLPIHTTYGPPDSLCHGYEWSSKQRQGLSHIVISI
jgi:hypothetical protein